MVFSDCELRMVDAWLGQKIDVFLVVGCRKAEQKAAGVKVGMEGGRANVRQFWRVRNFTTMTDRTFN